MYTVDIEFSVGLEDLFQDQDDLFTGTGICMQNNANSPEKSSTMKFLEANYFATRVIYSLLNGP